MLRIPMVACKAYLNVSSEGFMILVSVDLVWATFVDQRVSLPANEIYNVHHSSGIIPTQITRGDYFGSALTEVIDLHGLRSLFNAQKCTTMLK